jgi:hypothetical protein
MSSLPDICEIFTNLRQNVFHQFSGAILLNVVIRKMVVASLKKPANHFVINVSVTQPTQYRQTTRGHFKPWIMRRTRNFY